MVKVANSIESLFSWIHTIELKITRPAAGWPASLFSIGWQFFIFRFNQTFTGETQDSNTLYVGQTKKLTCAHRLSYLLVFLLVQPITLLHSQLFYRCISESNEILVSGGSLDFDFTYLHVAGLDPPYASPAVSSTAVLAVSLPTSPHVRLESIGC